MGLALLLSAFKTIVAAEPYHEANDTSQSARNMRFA
jgi:hypothetical protein